MIIKIPCGQNVLLFRSLEVEYDLSYKELAEVDHTEERCTCWGDEYV